MRRVFFSTIVLMLLLGLGLGIYGYAEAQRDPVVRRATIGLAGWPKDAPPLKLLLISDIHVADPDMPSVRLAGIVAQLNNLRADAVLIAGDMVSDKALSQRVDNARAIAPLSGFTAPLGTYVVWGNHDHWRGITSMRRELRKARVRLLRDEAVMIGPLILGGIDDSVTDHSDFEGTLRRMRALGPGPKAMLSHGTGYHKWLPSDVPLLLAGHDHCGQISLPVPGWPTRHCGIERRGGTTMVTGAGLGTSIVPLRINAPPDVWLVTVGPALDQP